MRFVPVVSLHWFDEILEMLYAYLIFYGAAALWITREHFSVGDWIGATILKGSRTKYLYRAVLEVLVLIFAAIFFYYSLRLTILAQDVTNVFAIPKRILYSCMPVRGRDHDHLFHPKHRRGDHPSDRSQDKGGNNLDRLKAADFFDTLEDSYGYSICCSSRPFQRLSTPRP